MGKRTSVDADGAAAFRKRQKITHDVPTGEDVTTGEQLQRLLAFNQDMRQARHGKLNANSTNFISMLGFHEAKHR